MSKFWCLLTMCIKTTQITITIFYFSFQTSVVFFKQQLILRLSFHLLFYCFLIVLMRTFWKALRLNEIRQLVSSWRHGDYKKVILRLYHFPDRRVKKEVSPRLNLCIDFRESGRSGDYFGKQQWRPSLLGLFCIWQMGLTKMEETKSRAYSCGTQSGELESSAGMGSWEPRYLI